MAPEDFPEKVAQLASKVDVGVKDMKIEWLPDHITYYIVIIVLIHKKNVLRSFTFNISVSGLDPWYLKQWSIESNPILPPFTWVILSKWLFLKVMDWGGWPCDSWSGIHRLPCMSYPPLLLHEALRLSGGQCDVWGKDINLSRLKVDFNMQNSYSLWQ